MMKRSRDNSEHYLWGEGCDGWQLSKSKDLSVISESMPAGTSEILHYHDISRQFFYVLNGEATFEIEDETVFLQAHEGVTVPPKTWHRISNRSLSPLDFLVVSQPESHGDRIEIIPYSEELKSHIRSLNYAWLERYFRVEESDARSLNHPKEEILDKGGHIFYVRKNDGIIGTTSLLKKPDGVSELAKMAVDEHHRGHGIGKMLIKFSISEARRQGLSKLILYSNTQLEAAIHLYRKFGFVEIPLESGLYERANIKMELVL